MTEKEKLETGVLQLATLRDVPRVQVMVDAAFSKYIERMGQLPGPMKADYPAQVAQKRLYVLKTQAKVVGAIIMYRENDAIALGNVVVDVNEQGRGYGRQLMLSAEHFAREQGLSATTLYTNEKMTENLAMYPKLGYVEVDRRLDQGYNRVFFRKELT